MEGEWSRRDEEASHTFLGIGCNEQKYFVADAKVSYRVTPHLTADVGVDNLNDRKYFEYHPFPQRTFLVDLKYAY